MPVEQINCPKCGGRAGEYEEDKWKCLNPKCGTHFNYSPPPVETISREEHIFKDETDVFTCKTCRGQFDPHLHARHKCSSCGGELCEKHWESGDGRCSSCIGHSRGTKYGAFAVLFVALYGALIVFGLGTRIDEGWRNLPPLLGLVFSVVVGLGIQKVAGLSGPKGVLVLFIVYPLLTMLIYKGFALEPWSFENVKQELRRLKEEAEKAKRKQSSSAVFPEVPLRSRATPPWCDGQRCHRSLENRPVIIESKPARGGGVHDRHFASF